MLAERWLAAGAMAVVGFAILFSGVINGYFAAAATAAMLTFVLPVTIPAPISAIPARLEGWALAAAAGICAHMLLWPARPRATLRADAARACVALADLAGPELAATAAIRPQRRAPGGRSLRGPFLATPHRPTGPTGPTAALASLVDELDWLLSFLAPPGRLAAARVVPRGERRGCGGNGFGLTSERRHAGRWQRAAGLPADRRGA